MTLDKEEHRALLLELFDKMQFMGASRVIVYELGEALVRATVIPLKG